MQVRYICGYQPESVVLSAAVFNFIVVFVSLRPACKYALSYPVIYKFYQSICDCKTLTCDLLFLAALSLSLSACLSVIDPDL